MSVDNPGQGRPDHKSEAQRRRGMMRMEDVFAASPVIAVLTITDVRHAAPLARALMVGGVGAMEVTMRTPCALEAVRVIADEVPDALVGCSTILSARDLYARSMPPPRARRWSCWTWASPPPCPICPAFPRPRS